MKKNRNNIKTCIYLSITILLCSCNKWLDVKPSDRLSEEMLFSTQSGFQNALTGVYMEMNNTSVYGRTMTTEFLDILAQYYYINTNKYLPYVNFQYTEENVKKSIENMWNKTYSLICNCNVIIDHCNNDGAKVLTPEQLAIIKGEALGLRAMMHLDMLRIFGPIYSEQNMTIKAIPYTTLSDQSVQPILSAQDALKKVIADLKEAAELLKANDPVIENGVMNSSDANGNYYRYRQHRMNYYAVQALLVRAYLWGNDRSNAIQTVTTLINEVESKNTFPFTLSSAITSTTNPDRIFSTEVIFALYNSQRSENIYEYNFTPTLGDDSQFILRAGGTYSAGRVTALYNDANDYRFKIWASTVLDGIEIVYTNKFKEPSTNSNFRYMQPLIRMSEMYLALAELTDNIDLANECVNKIRSHRNCTSITSTAATLNQNITSEFRREMIGEGQMFFYYKRFATLKLPDGTNKGKNNTRSVTTANYTMPLPDSEISTRTE